ECPVLTTDCGAIPLTRAGAVPYLEFLSRFGGTDLNVNAVKRGGENAMNHCRTLRDLEAQVAEKIFKNIHTVAKAFKLLDVNKTGLVQARELRRVLETSVRGLLDERFYFRFAKHYNVDKDTAVDYNVFLKNLGTNNDLNLKYDVGSQEVSWEEQRAKNPSRECLPSSLSPEDIRGNYSLDDLERVFCQEVSAS
uniref:EF-hand domain-containing protein n=1 Tax=Sus scrofa TaxID=9823 RepID=A0A8W4FLD2_PIG